jgi:hypothetical protein
MDALFFLLPIAVVAAAYVSPATQPSKAAQPLDSCCN